MAIKPNRYVKLASDKNPFTDFIELNDFEGFLCTSFQSLGINRKLDFLAIKNRQFSVENKIEFNKYSLSIEILTKYSEYEQKYKELITFLDRNKKDGFRLYYRPYEGMETRYCVCYLEKTTKAEKLQPVILLLQQCSLWYGEEKKETTKKIVEESENLFAFVEDNGYYSAGFFLDKGISNYYCVEFFGNVSAQSFIKNESYNEIPLNLIIYGECVNPAVNLFEKDKNTPIRKLQINAIIDKDHYVEIVSSILGNGIWLVDKNTKEKTPYDDKINNEFGSPYFYIGNGEYIITVSADGESDCLADVFYKEEYSE